jgi:glutaredoxin
MIKQYAALTSALLLGLFTMSLFAFSAQAQTPPILFFSNTCPHCQNVEAEITKRGYREKLAIVEKEVTTNKENSNEFYAALKVCNFPAEQAGVPMVFSNNKCYLGEMDAMNELLRLAGDTDVSPFLVTQKALAPTTTAAGNIVASEILPVVSAGIPHAEAKRNTLIFIASMTMAMVGLVAVGYWKQGGKKLKNKQLNKVVLLSFLTLGTVVLNGFLFAKSFTINAFCPVCTIAVGAGLGVSKYLGIDDVISGVWIGGLTVSMTMWLINWLTSKKIKFFGRKPLIVILMFAMVIVPLQWSNMIGVAGNTLWGQDKIILGMIFGTVGFILAYIVNLIILRRHAGEVYFPFQKVVFPITTMIIESLFFFFIVY